MTSREKMLLMISLGAVAAGILFVGYSFVYAPLTDAWERRGTAETELATKEKEYKDETAKNEAILKVNPRLGQWNKLSLPPRNPDPRSPGVSLEDQKIRHLSNIKTEYEAALRDILSKSKMKMETVKITEPKQMSPLGAPPKVAQKGQPPLYDRVAFRITGTGPQEAVYKALKDFHSTELLHEVRSLKLNILGAKGAKEKADPKTLEMDMTVEALIVDKAQDRSSMRPDSLSAPPRVLAEPARDYAVLSKRSLFTGLAKAPPPPQEDEEPEVDPRTLVSERERREVLEFVKVTMLAYNAKKERWEATLYDQAQGKGEEIKVDGRLYKSFSLYGERDKEIMAAKVVYIDGQQLVFTADGKTYRARVGDFLDVVCKEPLSESEKKKLGL